MTVREVSQAWWMRVVVWIVGVLIPIIVAFCMAWATDFSARVSRLETTASSNSSRLSTLEERSVDIRDRLVRIEDLLTTRLPAKGK